MAAVSAPVEAVFVHYGTAHLTQAAVWSLRTCYPDLPISVLDNASPDGSGDALERVAHEAAFTLVRSPTNVHHGPGMDALLRHSTRPFVLLMDTDAFSYRPGFVELLLAALTPEDAYMAGQKIWVDGDGFNVAPGVTGALGYVHPYCALVRREAYLTLPPFEKHGAPCLANERAAAARGLQLVEAPVGRYVWHAGRGTVQTYGYKLGWQARLASLRRRLQRKGPGGF